MALRNRTLANARRTLSRPRLDRLEDRTVPTGWGFSLGGAASDVGDNVDVDPAGNLFVAGYFSGTIDFDPLGNQAVLSSVGLYNNYLAKYSPQGQLEWGRCIAGSSSFPLGSTVDLAGNAYLFSKVVSPATVTITGTGGYVGPSLAPVGTNVDGLITKFSPDGSVVWTRQFGGSAALIGGYDKELAVGPDGSIFAVGPMSAGMVDFDPTGVHTGDTDILTFSGVYDIFIAKYGADGSFLWARQASGTGSDYARGVAVDSVGNSYVSGSFQNQCEFGPFALTSRGASDGFVAKLDPAGAFVWARRAGGTGGENLPDIQIYREPTTGTESIFVGGHFSTNGTPADFGDPTNPIDVGAAALISSGNDVVVLKLSTEGGFLWSRQLGGAIDGDVCYGIAVDAGGNVYSTGHFGATADFDPGPGTAYLPDGGILVWKLDSAGSYAGARRMGTVGGGIGWGIAADSGGFVYVTGPFHGAFAADTGAGTVALTSLGTGDDAFVVRINPTPDAIADATRFFVVNDGSPDRTYRYDSPGNSLGNSALATGNTAPRGAASTAAGTVVWIVDANRTVYVYNSGGALLGSWLAGGINPSAKVEGIATNGTDVWLLDNKAEKVFRYAGAASRLNGTQSASSSFSLTRANSNGKGIVTDGTSLWVVDDGSTDKVFKYTLAGALLGSWTIAAANASPTGLTIDPANVSDIWIVDNGTDKVYQYTGAASRTSGNQNAASTFALAAGNTNPQDIADPPPWMAEQVDRVAVPNNNAARLLRFDWDASGASKQETTPRREERRQESRPSFQTISTAEARPFHGTVVMGDWFRVHESEFRPIDLTDFGQFSVRFFTTLP